MIELVIPSLFTPPIIRMVNVPKIGKILQKIDNYDKDLLLPIFTKAVLINDDIKMYLSEFTLDFTKTHNPSTLESLINILREEGLTLTMNITQEDIKKAEEEIENNITTLKTLAESQVLGTQDILTTLKVITITNNLTLLQILTKRNLTNYIINPTTVLEARILTQKIGIDYITY